MDKPAKVFHNSLRELLGGQVRSVLEQVHHIRHNVGREFVGVFGAPLVGDQPRESFVFAGRARMVEYRTRAAKGVRGLRHRPAVERHTPEHFVSDLSQIVGIEKVEGMKKHIVDRVGTGIEGAIVVECVLFDTGY